MLGQLESGTVHTTGGDGAWVMRFSCAVGYGRLTWGSLVGWLDGAG